MKKFKKTISLLIVLSILTLSNNVFAMSPTFPNEIRYTRGVGNTCYYVDSSARSYTSMVNAAANNWVYTGVGSNPIYMAAVSSNRGTHIDVYAENFSVYMGNIEAYTTLWTSNSIIIDTNGTTNYFYGEIMLDSSYNMTTAIIIHEMGHCFGLADNDNLNSIMFGYVDGNVRTVQKCDNDTINYLY